jgi:hypothetical protein
MKSKRGCCKPRSESRDRPGTRKLFNVKTSEIQLHAFMTINCSAIFVAAMFALGAANESAAQTLAQRSLDIILEGDDPSEVFTFDLPFDALVPIRVSIDGLFENLDTSETGVRYKLWWPRADGGGIDGPRELDFIRLPPSGRLPLQFEQSIGFTPDTVFFAIEGGGPTDHFRYVGDLVIQQVPEPGTFTLIGAGAVAWALCRRLRKRIETTV